MSINGKQRSGEWRVKASEQMQQLRDVARNRDRFAARVISAREYKFRWKG
jgi:hypothetical protein